MTEIIVAGIALCSGFAIRHFWPVRRQQPLTPDEPTFYVDTRGVAKRVVPEWWGVGRP